MISYGVSCSYDTVPDKDYQKEKQKNQAKRNKNEKDRRQAALRVLNEE